METYQKQPLHLKSLLEQRLFELKAMQHHTHIAHQQQELLYLALQYQLVDEKMTLVILLGLFINNKM